MEAIKLLLLAGWVLVITANWTWIFVLGLPIAVAIVFDIIFFILSIKTLRDNN